MSRVLQQNVHSVGENYTFNEQVFKITSLDQHQHLFYAYLCDHWHLPVCSFIINQNLEQRVNIKFSFKLCILSVEISKVLQKIFSKEAMSWMRGFEWHLASQKRHRILLADYEKSGHLSNGTTPEKV